jgi:hypothetical protein
MSEDEKDTWCLEVAREMGPAFEEMAHRYIENGRRRHSADPLERSYQAEYDRQALALERRVIFGGRDA